MSVKSGSEAGVYLLSVYLSINHIPFLINILITKSTFPKSLEQKTRLFYVISISHFIVFRDLFNMDQRTKII